MSDWPTAHNLFEHACYTHADVLELLDRAALNLFTMLETLGFRPEVIDEVQRAVLGLDSPDISAALLFACNSLVPNLEQTGDEIEHLLDALEGKYIPRWSRWRSNSWYGSHSADGPQLLRRRSMGLAFTGCVERRTTAGARGR